MADVSWPAPDVMRLRWSQNPLPRRSWSVLDEEIDRQAGDPLRHQLRLTDHDGGLTVSRTDGSVVFESIGDVRWPEIELSVRMPVGWSFYACGERTGLLERRGRRYTSWTTDRFETLAPNTDELYVAVPFLLALDERGRCCGLFMNTTWRSSFDLTDLQGETMTLATVGPELDLFVVGGPDPSSVLRQFTSLTGTMPMPPRWGLGYHQSRWSYASAEALLEVAAEFRRRRLPLDVIGVDIDYMDGYRPFTWNSETFPDPGRLVSALHAQGCHVVAVNDCAVKVDPPGRNAVRDEGSERGFFLRTPEGHEFSAYVWPGRSALPDFARSDVRQWWAGLHRFFVDAGIDGVLNDMNEPGLRDRPLDDPHAQRVEVPDEVEHGDLFERAQHAEVHNIYGLLHARACAEGMRSLRPDRRSLVLSRAGFAGIQRFAGTWTGDTWSSWEHLEMSLPEIINLGLSGIALAGSDIGGFFGDCDAELLVRWMQLGALCPLMRGNNARGCTPQEPWVWDRATEDSCRRSLELRSRLLPYLYTAFAEAHRSGTPVLRPLWWADTADPACRRISDQALLGDSLMVAPVTRPGVTARAVYLPAGGWFDLRTNDVISGSTSVLVSARLDEEPVIFARAGQVVPLGPVMQWSDEQPLDPLSLHVFPDLGGRAHGTLYEDDGISHAHEHGAFTVTDYDFDRHRLVSRRFGDYQPGQRQVSITIHESDGTVAEFAIADGNGCWEIGQ